MDENINKWSVRLKFLQLPFSKRRKIGELMITGSFSNIYASENDRSIKFLKEINDSKRFNELSYNMLKSAEEQSVVKTNSDSFNDMLNTGLIEDIVIKPKYTTFFGGAIDDITTPEYNDSILIGELLAKEGYIVKNGGYRGLMEAVSMGVKNFDGTVIGYTCKTFQSTVGNRFLSKTIICQDMYDRLRGLIEESEVFIIQKGGIGTISELCLLLDIIRKKDVKPKIYIFGDDFKALMNEICNIMSERYCDTIFYCKDYSEFEEKFIKKD